MKAKICAAAIAAMGLTACNQTGNEMALSAVSSAGSTGVTSEASSQTGEARRVQSNTDTQARGMDLSRVGVPLQDVAQGRTARRNIMAEIKDNMAKQRAEIAAQQGFSMAASAAMGGLSVTAAPALVGQAVGTAAMIGTISATEVQIDQAMAKNEARRTAEQVVPNEDRPYEAQAILSIADGPSGKSASWQNPQTGSSGTVTIRQDDASGGIRCRDVQQVWNRGGQSKRGSMPICNGRGIWYDMS